MIQMDEIPLNEETLDILSELEWFVKPENYKCVPCQGRNFKGQKEKYINHDYFREIRAKGRGHDGFPEASLSHSFRPGSIGDCEPGYQTKLFNEGVDRSTKFLTKFQTHLNLKRNALWAIYPPVDGFIGWHNNANASAYNFIFTYSEDGNGYWEHFDTGTQEIVRINDKPGWQCKAGYFGAYEDGMDKVCYHCASNESETGTRMTVAFVMDRSEVSQGLQEWVIEDISG